MLIAIYGITLLGISFALHPDRTLTHHEVMFAQPAREMLATGDWLVPRPEGDSWLLDVKATVAGPDGQAGVLVSSSEETTAL